MAGDFETTRRAPSHEDLSFDALVRRVARVEGDVEDLGKAEDERRQHHFARVRFARRLLQTVAIVGVIAWFLSLNVAVWRLIELLGEALAQAPQENLHPTEHQELADT
jgi:hypothetical protein